MQKVDTDSVVVSLLRVHAIAGDGDEQEARRERATISRFQRIPRVARRTLQIMDDAFGLDHERGLSKPNNKKHNALISAEIDVLLEAA